ncbi:MAG: DegT/DnrJ/EryC1/StrS family aminotransferase [Candidatus Pedobacter colombiensis]|uniref:DegT/DnrJ/EryC1/StrS family aminotransferase n=1 Tax=Candidatus Pedobacter colombiensis TaxID=3121371 RepID=A0AAJ5W815_9SPHI|nr:DegT/DnrJ/EryC1/StrS family aminotransferase [Pedobacter sp.]WEK19674.1 MAG: DegT/DnrJ/EryC1/StrS family aminotransferase [Pedobacter sp.]
MIKRLSKSVVGIKEAEAVSKIIVEDGYLGMGAEVGFFEKDIADYLEIPVGNVVCVNTGTSALHLAVESIMERGDEILVPSFTFLASYQAISASGIIPVSCDIYEDTFTLDLEDAEKRITPKTKAIMAVHYASNPANLDNIYNFAKEKGLRVIEDAAHAFGCTYKSKKIGSFGDIVCFSFDGIKNITSGEGGALITSDKEVLSIVKDARLLGIENDSAKRYAGQRSWDFDVKRQGYRYHMSNIFAAIGRVQLNRFEAEFAPKRRKLFAEYRSLLSGNRNIVLQSFLDTSDIIPHIFCIRVLDGKRDDLKQHLESIQIQTGVHYKPNHLLSFYDNSGVKLPVTEKLYGEILTLPLHPELDSADVQEICLIINNYLTNK